MSPIISGILFNAGFCLISAFITCSLGFFVYAQKPSSQVHRLFLAVMISAAYWATGEFFIWQAGSLEGVTFWLKFSSFWPLTIAFGSHFILEFTGTFRDGKRKRIILACIYLIAIALSFIGVFTDCLYTAAYLPGTGYVYLPAGCNPLYLADILFTAFIMLWSFCVGFISWRYTEPGIKHRQNSLLFAGIIITIFFGMLSGIVLPIFCIYIPNLVFIGFVFLSVLIVYAMKHYGLFVLSPETAVPEIMKTMPDGLILVDSGGGIVAANDSAGNIFPSLKNSPAGRSAEELVSPGNYGAIKDIITKKGEISDFEIGLPGKTTRYVSVSGSVVRDRSDEPSGAVLIIRDITERKASENALRVANDKLSLLSQLTRHDISNLITALSGYLFLLDDKLKDPEEKLYLGKSIEITDRVMKQIEFSRSYHDIGLEKPMWKGLGEQISGAAESLVRGDVQVRLNIDPVLIYADPLVEKVFYSLIENAIRHGKKITEIVVSAEEQEDGSLILRIEDDGIGVPEDEKDKIFSYGYGRNTGFGLAFSRELLSVTGIEISENGVFGEGATFEIHIPKGAWKRRPGSPDQS
ncbi:multi-sensor signal transduction histidine kinase [Methanolacinia petrolearia DSM 11571]|uniref:Multi-sensor signal transduction histidine kinase n=1 Tax=Methanolacinia petrolearia (strain DSM 11571 / OCM 486 / SEBR 4847) TaxID=679926 RepID=E1RHH8_METP4|nr:ATP-binding protein [Methanolacinia petrolearia]ADN37561.1 multi-sensor signal transduction histidine kinase [Methanolacinia petrolearia DSM 11571]